MTANEDVLVPQREEAPSPPLFWRSALAGAFQLSWLPIATYFLSVEWIPLASGALEALALFLFGCALAPLLVVGLSCAAKRWNKPPLLNNVQLVAVQVVVTTAGIALLLLVRTAVISSDAAFGGVFLVGCGVSLGVTLSLAQLMEGSRNQVALSSLLWVVMNSAGLFVAASVDMIVSLCIGLCANTLAAVLLATPSAQNSVKESVQMSNLFRERRANLFMRYWTAFFLLGLFTLVMVLLFVAAPRTPANLPSQSYCWVGIVAFGLLLGIGWVRKREFDYPLSFSLMTLLALPTFFPFNPGTQFSQHLSLILSAGWVMCLIGMLPPMLWELRLLARERRRALAALGCSALMSGAFCGLLVFGVQWVWFWHKGELATSFERILLVSTCGVVAIMATFLVTNVLVNGQVIRSVNLLANGQFEILLGNLFAGPAPAGSVEVKEAPEPEGANLPDRCRLIALEKKLTPREYDVLVLLAQGNGLSKVQEDLYISEGTAITHRRNIYRKLDVHSRQELITYVAEFDASSE